MSERTTAGEQRRRTEKLGYRRGLMQHIGQTRGIAQACAGVLTRGFFGRMKWMLTGR